MPELIKETKSFRVANEGEAVECINDWRARQNQEGFTVKNAKYVIKEKKAKGEVVESYVIVEITIVYGEF